MTTKRRARRQAKPAEQEAPRSALVNLWQWRAANPHLFPSNISLRWHLRQHRDAYVTAGALMEIAGRLVCDPTLMERTMREVGARTASDRATTSGEKY